MTRLALARRLFFAAVLALVFVYGVAVGRYEVFPFAVMELGVRSVADVFKERNTIVRTRPDHFLEPARYAGHGVTHADTNRMAPGLTFLQGFFDGNNEMRLVRPDGSIVRRWPVRFSALVTDTSHIQTGYFVPKTDWNIEIHGGVMRPDGSVVFVFERAALITLDRCGAVQWVLRRMAHHSVDLSADGGFWVPGIRFVGSGSASPFLLLAPPFYEDTIMKISAEGKVLSEMSLPGVLISNNLQASTLFANGMPNLELQKSGNKVGEEITHLNDVEELPRAIADRFPQFAAGDLLVSERDYNLLMVIDPNTQHVKWIQQGPWMKQHDPDFDASGRISVLSNNSDGTRDGTILKGSTILTVDPSTSHVTRAFGGQPDQPMYTYERGKHQRLENGNVLIAESSSGRVIEVDPNGRVVWEFINRFDATSVAIVTDAHRYQPDYFTVQDWTCP